MREILFLISFGILVQATTVEQLFNIKTINVESKTIQDKREYNGYVQIADDKIYTVTIKQDGFIRNLTSPNIYDRVRKGQKLFDIYSPKIYKAQIELLSALQVSPELASMIENRLKLYDVTGQSIMAIKESKKVRKYLPFYSYFKGVVVEKSVTEGSSVKKGMEVYKIADLSKVWVVAKAYEQDRTFIKKGTRVEVTLSGSKQIHRATIDHVYPLVDPKNKTIDFRLTLSNKNGKIQPNSYATINIIKPKKSRLILPNTAVVTKGEKHLVFVPSEYEGEYKSKLVNAKRISATQFEIISGLKKGDKVGNNSLFLLDSDVVINGED
jgi:Cu(I)/Ag(I) efflux system membrane fusion protein